MINLNLNITSRFYRTEPTLASLFGVSQFATTWRTNEEGVAFINAPAGYDILWGIVESETLNGPVVDVVATGSGPSVSLPLASESNYYKYYDLTVQFVSPFGKEYFLNKRRAFACYPPRFTREEAHEILTVNGDTCVSTLQDQGDGLTGLATDTFERTYTDVDRGGFRIWIEGDATDRIRFTNLWSSDPDTNKIRIQPSSDGVSFTATHAARPDALTINGNCHGILFDGLAWEDQGLTRGFELAQIVPAVGGFCFRGEFGGGLPNSHITLCGCTITGIPADPGGSGPGISFQTANNITYNYDTYVVEGLVFHDIDIHNTGAEAVYINRFQDTDTPKYCSIDGLRIFRVTAENAGWDGFQFGICKNMEMHNCITTNHGALNNATHQYGLIFNHGCSGMAYRNYINNGKAPLFRHIGTTGGDMAIFSNVVYQTQAIGEVIFYNIFENIEEAITQERFFNNTIISPGQIEVADTGNPTSRIVLTLQNNLFVSDQTLPTLVTVSTDVDDNIGDYLITENYIESTATIGDYHFRNAASQNYHLTDQSSVFTGDVVDFYHTLKDYDYEGIKAVTNACGAYSGYELFTLLPPKEIVSIAQPDDEEVDEGTLLNTILFPASVTATLADASTAKINVDEWTDVDTYDPDTPGDYDFEAVLILPNQVANTAGITATITITVVVPAFEDTDISWDVMLRPGGIIDTAGVCTWTNEGTDGDTATDGVGNSPQASGGTPPNYLYVGYDSANTETLFLPTVDRSREYHAFIGVYKINNADREIIDFNGSHRIRFLGAGTVSLGSTTSGLAVANNTWINLYNYCPSSGTTGGIQNIDNGASENTNVAVSAAGLSGNGTIGIGNNAGAATFTLNGGLRYVYIKFGALTPTEVSDMKAWLATNYPPGAAP